MAFLAAGTVGLTALKVQKDQQARDSALFSAVWAGDTAGVERALRAGANPNAVDASGRRPLPLLQEIQDPEARENVYRVLHRAGAKP